METQAPRGDHCGLPHDFAVLLYHFLRRASRVEKQVESTAKLTVLDERLVAGRAEDHDVRSCGAVQEDAMRGGFAGRVVVAVLDIDLRQNPGISNGRRTADFNDKYLTGWMPYSF